MLYTVFDKTAYEKEHYDPDVVSTVKISTTMFTIRCYIGINNILDYSETHDLSSEEVTLFALKGYVMLPANTSEYLISSNRADVNIRYSTKLHLG